MLVRACVCACVRESVLILSILSACRALEQEETRRPRLLCFFCMHASFLRIYATIACVHFHAYYSNIYGVGGGGGGGGKHTPTYVCITHVFM